MSKEDILSIEELVEKVDQLKKQDKLDLSSDQDLSIALMNLISIEEHFFFTGVKTGKDSYYEMLNEIREIRKELLKKNYQGVRRRSLVHLEASAGRLDAADGGRHETAFAGT